MVNEHGGETRYFFKTTHQVSCLHLTDVKAGPEVGAGRNRWCLRAAFCSSALGGQVRQDGRAAEVGAVFFSSR